MTTKIFINYRRSANLKDAQLLHAALCRYFGQSHVFLDVSGLDGGDHWLHKLEKQVDASTAMVSLIGKGWAEAADENGNRRLDNPNDFVRFEIARALSREMPVLPVLVDGASMPDIARLPSNLLPLTFAQAMLLRQESFNDDAKRIAERLKLLLAIAGKRGVASWKAGAMVAAALAVGIAAGHQLTAPRLPVTLVEPVCAPGPQASNGDPSFDCSTAKSPDELAICKNADIAKLDRALTGQYKNLKRHFGDTLERDQFVQTQVGWLERVRKACHSNEDCLSILYRCKINEFNLITQN